MEQSYSETTTADRIWVAMITLAIQNNTVTVSDISEQVDAHEMTVRRVVKTALHADILTRTRTHGDARTFHYSLAADNES